MGLLLSIYGKSGDISVPTFDISICNRECECVSGRFKTVSERFKTLCKQKGSGAFDSERSNE